MKQLLNSVLGVSGVTNRRKRCIVVLVMQETNVYFKIVKIVSSSPYKKVNSNGQKSSRYKKFIQSGIIIKLLIGVKILVRHDLVQTRTWTLRFNGLWLRTPHVFISPGILEV